MTRTEVHNLCHQTLLWSSIVVIHYPSSYFEEEVLETPFDLPSIVNFTLKVKHQSGILPMTMIYIRWCPGEMERPPRSAYSGPGHHPWARPRLSSPYHCCSREASHAVSLNVRVNSPCGYVLFLVQLPAQIAVSCLGRNTADISVDHHCCWAAGVFLTDIEPLFGPQKWFDLGNWFPYWAIGFLVICPWFVLSDELSHSLWLSTYWVQDCLSVGHHSILVNDYGGITVLATNTQFSNSCINLILRRLQ